MTADVVLWRHGRTEWNSAGRFQGQLDSVLDAHGERQVSAAALALAALRPAAILSSDASRARRTAEALAALTGLPVEIEVGLREVHLGQWAGLTREEVAERFPEEYAAWLAGADVARGGDGETLHAVGERAWAAISRRLAGLADGSGPLVAVTHGGTTLSALVEALGIPRELRRRLGPLGNARWSRLASYEAGWRLAEHNAGITVAVESVGDDGSR